MSARGPYRAAVPASIATAPIDIEGETLAEAEDAVRELTRFDAEMTASAARLSADDADDAPMELAPLASVLLRTESASSSQIEGVTAGARALALASLDNKWGDRGTGRNAQLVTANVVAMQRALAMADEMSIESILAVHEALLSGYDQAAPGRFRTAQVWIGSTAISPHTATFVPPHHTRVEAAMRDLVAFAERTDLPVLIQCAVAHAQFETIHPFNDGNGRVGRALVHTMLRHADVTRRLTVPVSAGLLADMTAYFAALTEYRAGHVEPIVGEFSQASFRAVTNGRRLVGDLEQVHGEWSERLPARRGSAARRLLPFLLSQPAVTMAQVEAVTGVALSAAQRAVEQLQDVGVLTQAGAGRRNRVWVADEVIDALDAFAERAGRRG